MSGKIRRAAVAITLATGVLVGGVGVQHAFAQTSSASPSATSSSSASGSGRGSSSTQHDCPNMGSNSTGNSSGTSG
jgi:hypothetical protein